MAISRRLLAWAIAPRLIDKASTGIGYYGRIGRALPGQQLQPAGTIPADPPPKSPTDQRVKPYYVLYPSPGTPGGDEDLAATTEALDWIFQITVAGGDIDDVLALADRIHGALHRWTPTVGGGVLTGPVGVPSGYNPGPVLLDRDVSPPRHFTPLQFHLHAHT